MMKSDIDIKDDIYKFIKGSELAEAVTGKLSKTKRPENSDKEDIVVSVLSSGSGQIQEAFVNVNIYVKDVTRGTQTEEDTIRLRELCGIAFKLLEVGIGDTFRFTLDAQRVYEVEGKDEHFINNKLLYRQCNEND
jgi:4-hydroxy-3-methylbut-2-en-1-yl diphosphate synthase IspG/GcpE